MKRTTASAAHKGRPNRPSPESGRMQAEATGSRCGHNTAETIVLTAQSGEARVVAEFLEILAKR